jgi:hypothetical protein
VRVGGEIIPNALIPASVPDDAVGVIGVSDVSGV